MHVIWALPTLPTAASALQSSISALERDITSLESQSTGLEPWLGRFTLLVAIGVALEIFVVIQDHREEVKEWRICELIPKGPSLIKLGTEIASVILVVAGVMGEFGVGLNISSINGQLRAKSAELRSKSDQLLAVVTQEAGNASKSASDAKEAAGEARADADAAEADLLKLRKETGARRLTEKQKVSIGKALATIPTTIVICRNPLDSEAGDFAGDLSDALSKAHWPRAYLNWIPNGKRGLYIGFTDSIVRDLPQVQLLKKALGDEGFPPQFLQLTVGDRSLSTPAEPHVLYLLIADHPPVATSAKATPKTTP